MIFFDLTYAMLYGIVMVVVAPRRRSSVGTSAHAGGNSSYASSCLYRQDPRTIAMLNSSYDVFPWYRCLLRNDHR